MTVAKLYHSEFRGFIFSDLEMLLKSLKRNFLVIDRLVSDR